MVGDEGKLIVLEGIDGAGKTTVAKTLVDELKRKGFNALYTYEPFDKELISILNKKGSVLGGIFEALIMAADRYNHIECLVKPALRAGMVVVMDRYYYSSLAYQGAHGVPLEWIRTLNNFALRPDLAIYLDVPEEVGLLRKKRSTTRIPYLESSKEFTRKVRQIYLDLVKNGELILVDGTQELDRVILECKKLICSKLGLLC